VVLIEDSVINKMHNCIKKIILIVFIIVVFFISCLPDPNRPTAASTWQTTRKISKDEQLIASISILGYSDCPINALNVINAKIKEADSADMEIKALLLAEIGFNSLNNGAFEQAIEAFDSALGIMTKTIANSEELEEIISLNGHEKEKVFKGEPYERVMCFLYRGLIFLAEGNYDNASASFKQAQLQDYRLIEGKSSFGNWTSLQYLQDLIDVLESDSNELILSSEIPEDLSFGEFKKGDDSLLFVATGLTPIKIFEETKNRDIKLSYIEIEPKVKGIRLSKILRNNSVFSSNEPITSNEQIICECLKPIEDIYIQAASHGRRDMDLILSAKKQRVKSFETTATTAEVVGIVSNQFGIYGLPVSLAALVVGSASRNKIDNADYVADLRQISSIPRYLFMSTFKSEWSFFKFDALDENGNTIFSKTFNMLDDKNRKFKVVIVRIYQ